MLCSLVGNRCTLGKCPFVFKKGEIGAQNAGSILLQEMAPEVELEVVWGCLLWCLLCRRTINVTHSEVFGSRPPVHQTRKLVPTLLGDSGEGKGQGRWDQGNNLPLLATLTYLPWKTKFDIKTTLTCIY